MGRERRSRGQGKGRHVRVQGANSDDGRVESHLNAGIDREVKSLASDPKGVASIPNGGSLKFQDTTPDPEE